MGDLFEYEKNVCSSTASLPQTSSPPDEISLFLQQIMVRSSSSSLSAYTSSVLANTGLQTQLSSNIGLWRASNALSDNIRSPAVGDGISAVDCSGAYSMANIRTDVPYVSSSSMGASETENDEYDCESEEGLDALVQEVSVKPVAGSSSKRSRAAEFHNLSEKRRRSRINEKMKALQNLIPNSHKTDKASMLDEAIEYLKQLQLQVQMLSMRNGLSLHPMCLPDGVQPIQLSQMRMDFDVGNKFQHLNATSKTTATHGASTSNIFGLPNQCGVSNQPMVSNMSNLINSETSFGLESPIRVHLGPTRLQTDAEEICKEDRLQYQPTNVNHTATNPLEFEAGGTGIMTFHAQASNLKGRDSIEAHMREANQSEGRVLKAIEPSLMLPSHLNSVYAESTRNDCIKD